MKTNFIENKLETQYVKKKNRRMRIFEHRIFSKSFGGKICHKWADVTYRMNKQKWRMRNYRPRISSKFFGGKNKNV